MIIIATPISGGSQDDPDLFVNVDTPDFPDRSNADYQSAVQGRDVVQIPPEKQGSEIRVSVQAYGADSQVSITASFNIDVSLLDGIPQDGHADAGTMRYYTFNAGSATEAIFAYSSRNSVKMYVSNSQRPLRGNPATFQYESSQHFHIPYTVDIYQQDKWAKNDGKFYIGVYAMDNATYTVMARSNDRSHQLLFEGRPQIDQLGAHECHFYKYVSESERCNVTFQLTPMSGDPDLFVSKTNKYPRNISTSEHASVNTIMRQDSVTIPNAPIDVYFVGVCGFVNTTFTLTASANCRNINYTKAIELTDGLSIQGSLERGGYRLYKFHVGDTSRIISFEVTAQSGDPDLFLKHEKFVCPHEADLSFTTQGSDFITVQPQDPFYCTNCDYYLLVTGASATSYRLLASGGSAYRMLPDGIPFTAHIEQHTFEYFYVEMDDPQSDLTIVATNLDQGDPDLFVSTTNPKPSKLTNYTWKSESIGSDAITIAANDPKACGLCTYYISVYAYTTANISIVATWAKPTELTLGEPQGGVVLKNSMQYYQLTTYGDHDDINVAVTSIAGKLELYVSTTVNPLRGNSSTFKYMLPYTVASKSIMIQHGENNNCQTTSGVQATVVCKYHIGVFGKTTANFTILVSSNHSVTTLQLGVPFEDHIGARLYEYFYVDVASPNRSLTVTLTPLQGDPDLFVSRIHQYPNQTQPVSQTMRSRSIAGDSIYVENAPMGRYYISVYGFRYSRFNILASLEQTGYNCTSPNPLECGIPNLIDGQPQTATVRDRQWQYFQYHLQDATQELSLTSTRVVGDPDLYVQFERLPNRTSFLTHSIRYGDDFIVLRNPPLGVYYIGVFAYSSCTFTLRVSSQNVSLQLQDGVPVQEMVNKHSSLEFLFNPSDLGRDVTFILTPLSGDPDLNVTLGNKHFESRFWLEDSVTVPHTWIQQACRGPMICLFRVLVYGYTASIFTLQASTSNTTILQDGVPQAGTVHRNQYIYYSYRCPPQTIITVTATPTRGRLALFANIGSQPPSTANHDFEAPSTNSVATLSFVAGSKGECRIGGDNILSCSYTIGVQGISHAVASDHYSISYSLLVQTRDYVTVLQNGMPVRGWARQHAELFYRFDVPVQGAELIVQLTKMTGDPDLYLSERTSHPSKVNYDRRSIHFGSDGIIVKHANATSYYVGVYAFANATYTITANLVMNDTSTQILPLIDGTPQSGAVAKGEVQKYSLKIAESSQTLTVSLTVLVGDPDLNVTYSGTGESVVHNRYGSDVIVIQNAQPGDYIVDVLGYQDAIYTVVASTKFVSTMLLDGVPIRDEVNYRQYDYFEVFVDRTDMDLTVTVTAFSGDPDLYVSTATEHPGPHSFNYSARLYGEDSVTIPKQQLRHGLYYISVFAPLNNCTYSIMATFSNQTMLQDGVPQAGQAATEAGLYYIYRTPMKHTNLKFSLSVYSGSADIFASNRGPPIAYDRSTYDWKSESRVGNPTVEIPMGQYRPGDDFYILVHSYSNCTFAVTASSATAVTTLQSGVTALQSGYGGEELLFSYDHTNPLYDLEIALTVIFGSADLYVSSIGKHGPWQWTTVGGQLPVVDIPQGSPMSRIGTYYVKAKVHTNATFSVTALSYDSNDQGNRTGNVLTDGIPQLVIVGRHKYRYFRFEVSGSEDVTISATPRYGDPDLYVTIGDHVPTRANSDYKSLTPGADEVTIPRADLFSKCGLGKCTIRVAAYAFQKSLCSVTAASSDRVAILEPGQTFTGTAQKDSFREFVTYVEPGSDLTVEVIPVSSGDPDLFLSSYPHPNFTHHEYHRMRRGRDSITVPNVGGQYYYISVFGYSAVTFRITASVESQAITLVDGHVQSGFVKKGLIRRYTYHIGNLTDSPLSLMLHNFDGNAVMYAATNFTHPGKYHYQYTTSAGAVGSIRGMISVAPEDPDVCQQCELYVSVLGVEDTYFSLLGSSGTGPATLLIYSEPIHGRVYQGGSGGSESSRMFFRFLIDGNATDVSIVVTTFSGAVDLYVTKSDSSSATETPSKVKYDFKDDGGSGSYRAVDIRHGGPGVYYAGVYISGPEPSSHFTITASADNVMLQIGIPQNGRLSQQGSKFFCHTSTDRDVEIQVQPLTGDEGMYFDVYVSTNNTHPDQSNSDFNEKIRRGETLRVPQLARKACKQVYANAESCILYVNVFPYIAQDAGKAFTITASTPESIKVLQNKRINDDSFNKTVTGSNWAYYETYVPSEAKHFLVEMEPCIGETDLYVDYKNFKPTEESYTWRSTSKDKFESVDINSQREFGTSFYIGVKLVDGEKASYNLRAVIQYENEPLNQTVSPKYPDLEVEQTGGNAIVSWSSTGLDTDIFTVYWVEHRFANEKKISTYSACGLVKGYQYYESEGFNKRQIANSMGDSVRKSAKISGLKSGKKYDVNVVATLSSGSSAVYRRLTYTHTGKSSTPGSGTQSNAFKIVLGIAIPLFLVCAAAIGYLYLKNRKLTRELNIEMHDVPIRLNEEMSSDNLGISPGLAGEQSKKYSRLLSEVDDDNELGDEEKLDFSSLPEV
eukprot:CAMPEP_0114512822 /NCGR_PEP_ID=MMETSP0109-20121206/15203_1 /TAXON_ID=29199 /ORGANISM="Chlorarachnion reptans, Strain CCCM449" /LENGTH=2525 /DNA_ID=CAMNT_0001692577 /DNA_START=282 /DNA_END=7859 /DNA_ORIENTATION=-